MLGGNFYLKGLLIEFVMPNLSLIYFSKSEISEKKNTIEFVLLCCEFTKVILK